MAARKTTKKKARSKAVVPSKPGTPTLPADLADLFGDALNRDKATAKGSGGWPFIKTSGPNLLLEGKVIPSPFDTVVVAAVRQNVYYPGKYDPSTPSGPTCFAIDAEGDEASMAPPADLQSKESDTCSSCALNAYGSGEGRGKACKNQVKLALLPADSKDFSVGEGALMTLPPTSLKAWGEYVRAVTERAQRPIFSVVSSFEKVASSGGGFQVRPIVERTRLIEDRDALLALHGRAASDVWTILTNPPSAGVGGADGPAGPKPTRRRRKVAA